MWKLVQHLQMTSIVFDLHSQFYVRVLERGFIVIACRFRNHFVRVSSIERTAVSAIHHAPSKTRQIILPSDASHGDVHRTFHCSCYIEHSR